MTKLNNIIKSFEEKGVFSTAKDTQELQQLNKSELISIIAELGYLLEDNDAHKMSNEQFKSFIEELQNHF